MELAAQRAEHSGSNTPSPKNRRPRDIDLGHDVVRCPPHSSTPKSPPAMPYFTNSAEWYEQSKLLLEARPTTVRPRPFNARRRSPHRKLTFRRTRA